MDFTKAENREPRRGTLVARRRNAAVGSVVVGPRSKYLIGTRVPCEDPRYPPLSQVRTKEGGHSKTWSTSGGTLCTLVKVSVVLYWSMTQAGVEG